MGTKLGIDDMEAVAHGIFLTYEQKKEIGKVSIELIKALKKAGYNPIEACVILELTRQYIQDTHKINLEIKDMRLNG